jgi:hypothetical protein
METTLERKYVKSGELARYLGLSQKFIEKNRRKIPGATKAGGIWIFSLPEIEKHLLNGQLLLPENNQAK